MRHRNKDPTAGMRRVRHTPYRDAPDGNDIWSRYGPTLRFDELLEAANIGRSKAYELTNPKHPRFDPHFPQGFPLFDSPRSPRVWWTHRVAAWVESRERKHLNDIQGDK